MADSSYTASRDRLYRTRRQPWTERELARLPPDLHINGRQLTGTRNTNYSNTLHNIMLTFITTDVKIDDL